jgi:hypothetical protein
MTPRRNTANNALSPQTISDPDLRPRPGRRRFLLPP